VGAGDATTAEQARDAIRGTTAIFDGLRMAYAIWPAGEAIQNHVFAALGEERALNAVYQGAVVKSNGPADRRIRTYLRAASGLLVDVTDRLCAAATPDDGLTPIRVTSLLS
jgi:hypothetical protein